MMTIQEELAKLRPELRYLRIQTQTLKRVHLLQKQKADKLEDENKKLKEEITKIEKEKQSLVEELEKVKRQRDTYKEMVFKANKEEIPSSVCSGRKRGGQRGHHGFGRKTSQKIDQYLHIFLQSCPTCHGSVKRTTVTTTHTVTDLPSWQTMYPVTTEYAVERQWCSNCKREVRAVPEGIIPGSKLGTTLLTMLMVWHYRMRLPFGKMKEQLAFLFHVQVSEGALALMLKRAKEYLRKDYQRFLQVARASPVKHADETGWRVSGKNWWCWTVATKNETLYAITESRGKGIAEKLLGGTEGVLVRDDYAAYQKLPMPQQSC